MKDMGVSPTVNTRATKLEVGLQAGGFCCSESRCPNERTSVTLSDREVFPRSPEIGENMPALTWW